MALNFNQKQNDLYYSAKAEYENYTQSGLQTFLLKALRYYIVYKNRQGKKRIAQLEEYLQEK